MEAEIKDGKVIMRKKESEDERTRKNLVEFLDDVWHLGKNANFDRWGKADCADWIAYLERQKEPNLSHIEDIDYKENLELSKNAVGMIRDGAAYYMMNSKSRQEVLDWLENIPKIIEQLTIRINELEKQKEQNIYKSSKSEIDFAKRYSEDVWEKLMSKFKAVEGYSIGCNDVSDIVLNAILNAFKWQKEQKPADDKAFEEWIDDWYQGSKEAGGDVVMSENEFKNWSRGIRNMYQQSTEWSEEDENMIRFYEMDYNNQIGDWPTKKIVEMRLAFKDWLCVRLKSLRPQPHWKPSYEQMKHLERCFSHGHTSQLPNQYVLESLYNDLKKL